jgi:hypothetical protein
MNAFSLMASLGSAADQGDVVQRRAGSPPAVGVIAHDGF